MAASELNPLQEDLQHVLAHTRELWDGLRERTIFVTGGTGFFGRWLLETFAHANAELALKARMVVLSRNPEGFLRGAPHLGEEAGIAFVRGDVRTLNADDVRRQLGRGGPSNFSFVIHAATEASAKLNAEDPLKMVDTIVDGTRAALEFAVATGAHRFLLTSSGAVYGNQPSEITHVPEEYAGSPDQTNAAFAYGEGKRLAELLCACFQKQHGLECVIARCFAFVGPYLPLDAHFAIGNFIRDAVAGGPIRIRGDGTPYRSYLYAADLAIWLWTMLFRGQSLRPYNLGSARDLPMSELAEAVRNALDTTVRVILELQPAPGAKPARYVPSVDRARVELGLAEHIALHEAIRRTARHAETRQAAAA